MGENIWMRWIIISYYKMFSSLTDRFFHGMNKRHTKLIDTGEIKASLQLSRSKKNSHSKSKTARLFDNSNLTSKRSSLNNTMRIQTKSQAQFFSQSQDKFVPPSPSAQAESQKPKRKNMAKTSSQFTPMATTAELQAIVKKHLDKQKNNDDQQNCGDIDRVQQLGVVFSIKDKLRRKIQTNAFKRFSNIHVSNGNTRSERVDQKHIKQLLAIVKRQHDGKPNENQITAANTESIQNSTQDIRKISAPPSQKEPDNRREPPAKTDEVKEIELLRKASQRKITESQTEAITQNLRKATEKSEKLKQNDQKIEELADKKQLKKVHPAKTQQIAVADAFQMKKLADEIQTKPGQKNAPPMHRKQQSKKMIETVEKSNIVGENIVSGFLTEVSTTRNQQKTQAKQNTSTRSIQQPQSTKTVQTTKQPQKQRIVKVQDLEDDEIEEVVINDRNPKQSKNNQDKTKKSQPQPDLPLVKKDSQKERQAQRDKEKKQKEKKEREQKEKQQKQREREREQQREREKEKQKQLQRQRKEKQNTKNKQNQKKEESSDEQEYEYNEIVDEIKTVFYLISEIGNYSVSEKPFIDEIGLQELQKISGIARFYIWQQFYFLEYQAVEIIKNKSQDLYNVPVNLLKEPDLEQFLSETVASEETQLQKIVRRTKKLYEQAKGVLPDSQKPLALNPKINYLKKCQKILQQQFFQLQKFYRIAVRKNQKREPALLRRLCQIIQVFCLLKYLNGQKTKEYVEIDDIENNNLHYQNNKHLIAL